MRAKFDKRVPIYWIFSAHPTVPCSIPVLIRNKKSSHYRVIPFIDSLRIRRDSDNDLLVLGFREISRHHAQIQSTAADFYLADCGSTNGIWQREKKITHAHPSNGFTFHVYMYFHIIVDDNSTSLYA